MDPVTTTIIIIACLLICCYFGYGRLKAGFEKSESMTGMGGGKRSKKGISKEQIGAILLAVVVIIYLCSNRSS